MHVVAVYTFELLNLRIIHRVSKKEQSKLFFS